MNPKEADNRPMMNAFRRWEETRPATHEEIMASLSSDIRSDLQNLRVRLNGSNPGDYGLFQVHTPREVTAHASLDLTRLLPVAMIKPYDWNITITLSTSGVSAPTTIIHLSTYIFVDGSIKPDNKVFRNIELHDKIKDYVHSGAVTQTDVSELTDLHKVTTLMLSYIPPNLASRKPL